MHLVLVPYIDHNEIVFNYESQSDDEQHRHPHVEMSTFLDDSRVLAKIAMKYLVFNIDGKFLYEVEFENP